MNSCLKKPCHRGFAFFDHDVIKFQTDHSGSFRYIILPNYTAIKFWLSMKISFSQMYTMLPFLLAKQKHFANNFFFIYKNFHSPSNKL